MKKLFYALMLSLAASLGASVAFAQTARVQIIHNSPDAATASVDIFAGAMEIYSNVDFRTATPFFDLPGGTYTIGLAPASGTNTAADTIKAFDITVANGSSYIVVANGIYSASGYNPAPPLTLDIFAAAQESSTTAGETDVLVFHGSTDAPTVDVMTPGSMTPLVDNTAYVDFQDYLNLPTNDYVLNVTDQTGSTVVASYEAPLQTLGLEDSAVAVIASGFLDPSNNSGGPEFGLWAALPSGGALIELPTAQARLQVIHNSADAAANMVDIYFNGSMLIDDFTFRTSSAFIDVPAEVTNEIAVAPSNSTSVADSLVAIPVVFSANETYVAIANGIVSTSGYSPAPGFSLDVYGMGQETASTAGNTDVLVFHGSTDAPTVDVATPGAGTPLVDDAAYGDFAGYLELPTADYILEVQNMGGNNILFSYLAPLATLNLDDFAIVVVASGFVDPSLNSNGPGFGLWVALPSGGNLVELPVAFASVDEVELQLSVFPNPATDNLRIQGLEQAAQYQIYDLAGKAVSNNIVQPQGVINILNLESGSYLLRIQLENSVIERKFIKW